MTGDELQFWTAVVGFVSTLLAVGLTSWLAMVREGRRIAAEDERRWHSETFRLASELFTIAFRIEEDLRVGALGVRWYNLSKQEDRVTPPFVDSESDRRDLETRGLDFINDRTPKIRDRLEEARRTLADLALVGEAEVVAAASDMLQSYEEVNDQLGWMAPTEDVENALESAKLTRQATVEAVRTMLGPERR